MIHTDHRTIEFAHRREQRKTIYFLRKQKQNIRELNDVRFHLIEILLIRRNADGFRRSILTFASCSFRLFDGVRFRFQILHPTFMTFAFEMMLQIVIVDEIPARTTRFVSICRLFDSARNSRAVQTVVLSSTRNVVIDRLIEQLASGFCGHGLLNFIEIFGFAFGLQDFALLIDTTVAFIFRTSFLRHGLDSCEREKDENENPQCERTSGKVKTTNPAPVDR